mgnify:CR=1 FL=1
MVEPYTLVIAPVDHIKKLLSLGGGQRVRRKAQCLFGGGEAVTVMAFNLFEIFLFFLIIVGRP